MFNKGLKPILLYYDKEGKRASLCITDYVERGDL